MLNDERFLIAGLGNPGIAHEKERHNIGYRVIHKLAKSHGYQLQPEFSLQGEISLVQFCGKAVVLLRPLTWMNHSGDSIRRTLMQYNVPLKHLLILCDDVALPLGKIRLRLRGSSGGHNGLKSVIYRMRTEEFARCRLGIGSPTTGELTRYVLNPFSKEEEVVVEEMMGKAQEIIKQWVSSDPETTMRFANTLSLDKEKPNDKK